MLVTRRVLYIYIYTSESVHEALIIYIYIYTYPNLCICQGGDPKMHCPSSSYICNFDVASTARQTHTACPSSSSQSPRTRLVVSTGLRPLPTHCHRSLQLPPAHDHAAILSTPRKTALCTIHLPYSILNGKPVAMIYDNTPSNYSTFTNKCQLAPCQLK